MAKAAARRKPVDDAVRFRRALVTPEGVDIGLRIASAGERAGAFIIDSLIMLAIMIGLTIGVGAAMGSNPETRDFLAIIWLVGFFLLRNFYFVIFEMGRRAATPGKRIMKLRVTSRSGGLLRAEAIFARNAMRELEIFLPLSFLASPGRSVDAWIVLMGLVWSGIFMLFPLFNRDRLRAGDIVAGTWVVQTPKRSLLPDLAQAPLDRAPAASVFTAQQLDAYGIKELQVLEDVLRSSSREAISLVATRIRTKIGWRRASDESDHWFLNAYYVELRRHLESSLLMGKRRADKHDRQKPR